MVTKKTIPEKLLNKQQKSKRKSEKDTASVKNHYLNKVFFLQTAFSQYM
jgi:hypothetical protein